MARFCGRCGLELSALVDGVALDPFDQEALGAGPPPENAPTTPKDPLPERPVRGPRDLLENFTPFPNAPDLFYCWESAWGGAMLIGTESVAVVLFNRGASLESAVIRIEGFDAIDRTVFGTEKNTGPIPRGAEVTVEVPSYEVPAPVSKMRVSLVWCKPASET